MVKTEHTDELYRLLAEIQDPQDIRDLLDDLCTRKEVENMAERVFAARLLLEEGKLFVDGHVDSVVYETPKRQIHRLAFWKKENS